MWLQEVVRQGRAEMSKIRGGLNPANALAKLEPLSELRGIQLPIGGDRAAVAMTAPPRGSARISLHWPRPLYHVSCIIHACVERPTRRCLRSRSDSKGARLQRALHLNDSVLLCLFVSVSVSLRHCTSVCLRVCVPRCCCVFVSLVSVLKCLCSLRPAVSPTGAGGQR